MKDTILDIMTQILKLDREDLIARFGDREVWDSLSRVEILFAIEDEYGIQFREEELTILVTPEKLCEATIRKVDEA